MSDTPSWTTFLVVPLIVILVIVGLTVAYEKRGPGRAVTQPN